MRIGMGYDLHRLVADRKLFLGGIEIPYPLGLKGHSDSDVVLHAVSDALLGAIAKGDIGTYFPDNDETYRNMDSRNIVGKAMSVLKEAGYEVNNIDCVIIAEKPKLLPYYDRIRESLAKLLSVAVEDVGLKAKTREGLDQTNPFIEVFATVLVIKSQL